MSDTVTLDAETEEKPAPGVLVDTDDSLAPDDAAALASARDALAAATQRETQARNAESAARAENARLRDQAARERAGRAADRKAVLAQAVESADAEIKSARAAKRAARAAGDDDAEMDADEALASALYRRNQASGELAQIGDEPTSGAGDHAPAERAQPQQWTPTERAQQWFRDHPRFNSDPGYKATAIALHNQLTSNGLTEAVNPDAYFSQLNAGLAAVYGDNHGRAPGDAMNSRANGGGGGNSQAAPPNRGGGNSSAAKLLQLASDLGKVRVQYRQDGTIALASFADAATRENMEEGAKICYAAEYQKNPKAALDRYTVEQIKIAEEIARGGNAGLVYGEGGTFR